MRRGVYPELVGGVKSTFLKKRPYGFEDLINSL